MSRTTIRYGPDRRQVGDLWLPPAAAAPVPVVVLVHGGFWRAPYTKRLMNRLAADLVRRGWAAWNVEYRSMRWCGGGGSWSTSVDDLAAALSKIATLEGVDPERVAVCGHSAGAQLAFCALARPALTAARAKPVRVAVSLSGVLDLVDAFDGHLGKDAVASFLGGTPDAVPGRYADSSPLAHLPIGIDQVVVHGADDPVVPRTMSEHYAKAAEAAGDRVVLEVFAGHGHLAMIDPQRDPWRIVAGHLNGFFA